MNVRTPSASLIAGLAIFGAMMGGFVVTAGSASAAEPATSSITHVNGHGILLLQNMRMARHDYVLITQAGTQAGPLFGMTGFNRSIAPGDRLIVTLDGETVISGTFDNNDWLQGTVAGNVTQSFDSSGTIQLIIR